MKIDLDDKEIDFLIKALVNNYASDQNDFDPLNIADSGTCYMVIGKVVSQSRKHKLFSATRDDRYTVVKTPINKKLFMGAGHHSIVAKNLLHKRLEFAAYQLAGIEQNGGMGTEFNEESDKQEKEDIKDVMRDLLVAFGLTADDLK